MHRSKKLRQRVTTDPDQEWLSVWLLAGINILRVCKLNREYPGNGLDARCRVTVSHLRPSRARPTSGSSRRYNVLRFIPIPHFIRPLYFPLVLPLVQTLYSNSRALFLSFSLLHFIVYTKLTRLVESSIDLLSSSSVSVCISKIHFTEQIARNYRQATTLSLSLCYCNEFFLRPHASRLFSTSIDSHSGFFFYLIGHR